jgi:phenylalanyl-tRNA synthetase beta chain
VLATHSHIAAILSLPLKSDPLKKPLKELPATELLQVEVDGEYVSRHIGALVSGVKVGPSPAWLKEALESVGQRSINNIVDATNYVMNDIGQPMHAFDAGKISKDGGVLKIAIRKAHEGEKVKVLTGEECILTNSMYVVSDATSGEALDIAGLKGGLATGTTADTTDLFVSVGNYDGTKIRKMSQTLKLFTDASARYQNRPSPLLTAYGMQEVLALITQIAGGEVVGVVDIQTSESTTESVSVTLSAINGKLGTQLSKENVGEVFTRLGIAFEEKEEMFTVTPPFERKDLRIPEDVIEEVGRIIGYDTVPATPLPELTSTPDQARFRGIERVKDLLIEHGCVEISTPSFTSSGDIQLANPLQDDRPYLRSSLYENMREALLNAVYVAPRVLGVESSVRLFEVGTVFTAEKEILSLAIGYKPLVGKKQQVLEELADVLSELLGEKFTVSQEEVLEIPLTPEKLILIGESYEPKRLVLQKYKPFSPYPFALRDIAVWSPLGTLESQVATLIMKDAGELLARMDVFDRFEKEGRVSHAFRLVFESFEKTLSDADLNPIMERITTTLNAQEGFTVR